MTRSSPCKTAVITGASSGIGEVFARQLAQRGHPLILVARPSDRLEKVRGALASQCGVDVTTRPTDLSQPTEIHGLAEELSAHRDLGVLVNNAGFGTMGDYADVAATTHEEMIQVHVSATALLSHAVLPAMIQQRSGAIINVASMSAFLIGPGQVIYASTKTFVKVFSESLFEEVRDQGVYVQALCPGFTKTGFHSTDHFASFDRSQISSQLFMTAEQVVDASLKALDQVMLQ